MPRTQIEQSSRRRRRAALLAAACALALVLGGAAAAAPPASGTPPAPAASIGTDASARTGVFCTSSSCRGASRWKVAAFAVAVLAIGWMARRDAAPPA